MVGRTGGELAAEAGFVRRTRRSADGAARAKTGGNAGRGRTTVPRVSAIGRGASECGHGGRLAAVGESCGRGGGTQHRAPSGALPRGLVERLTATAEIAASVFRQLGEPTTLGKKLRYVAVSGNGEARWLLPSSGAKAGPVLANWAPYRWRSRVGWRAVRAADRVGRVHELPGSVELELEAARSANWASLGWDGRDEPIAVVYIGTPGPRRKAVVHLVDRASATCRAVVKVPLAEEAKAAILHEAEVLEA